MPYLSSFLPKQPLYEQTCTMASREVEVESDSERVGKAITPLVGGAPRLVGRDPVAGCGRMVDEGLQIN